MAVSTLEILGFPNFLLHIHHPHIFPTDTLVLITSILLAIIIADVIVISLSQTYILSICFLHRDYQLGFILLQAHTTLPYTVVSQIILHWTRIGRSRGRAVIDQRWDSLRGPSLEDAVHTPCESDGHSPCLRYLYHSLSLGAFGPTTLTLVRCIMVRGC